MSSTTSLPSCGEGGHCDNVIGSKALVHGRLALGIRAAYRGRTRGLLLSVRQWTHGPNDAAPPQFQLLRQGSSRLVTVIEAQVLRKNKKGSDSDFISQGPSKNCDYHHTKDIHALYISILGLHLITLSLGLSLGPAVALLPEVRDDIARRLSFGFGEDVKAAVTPSRASGR